MSTEKLSSSYFKKSKEEFKKFCGHFTTKTAALFLVSTAAVAAVAYHSRGKISKGIESIYPKKDAKIENVNNDPDNENNPLPNNDNNKTNLEKPSDNPAKNVNSNNGNKELPDNKTQKVNNNPNDDNKELPDDHKTQKPELPSDNFEGPENKGPLNATVDNSTNDDTPNVESTKNDNNANNSGNGILDAKATTALSTLLTEGVNAGLGFTYEAGKFAGEVAVLGVSVNALWEGLKAVPKSITSVPGVVVSTAYSGVKDACSAIKELTLVTAYFGTGVASKVGEITHIYNRDVETSEVSLGGEADSITDMT
ncbi:MAG TPA: hypothetical protein QKA08_05370 [Candidatus Megaira endosymbiont of Nemacystus decipiens]|nr:hypothetical protein [Candidatus Megaera endosymbiont of Nemacystus decipiens]